MKGNEKDCICEKAENKHREYCDAYRLAEFFKKVGAMENSLLDKELGEI